jgi:hypothetical protein
MIDIVVIYLDNCDIDYKISILQQFFVCHLIFYYFIKFAIPSISFWRYLDVRNDILFLLKK